MSEYAIKFLETMTEILPKLSEQKARELLAYGEGMAAVIERNEKKMQEAG